MNPQGIENSSELWELIPKYVTEGGATYSKKKIYNKKIATLFTKQEHPKTLPFGLKHSSKAPGSDESLMKR